MMTDQFPMIHDDGPSGLTFVWWRPTATSIEITRAEVHVDKDAFRQAVADGWEGNMFDAPGVVLTDYHTDQSIGIYDHQEGRITLDPTREAFLGRVAEWLADQADYDEER